MDQPLMLPLPRRPLTRVVASQDQASVDQHQMLLQAHKRSTKEDSPEALEVSMPHHQMLPPVHKPSPVKEIMRSSLTLCNETT